MVIAVIRGAAVKPVTRIYQKKGTVWKEVLLVQYWKLNPDWSPYPIRPGPGENPPPPQPQTIPVIIHDRYLPPPTKVRGVSADHSSGTLAWDASPSATGYQILRRTTPAGVPTVFPTPTTWTPQLSYNVTGLAADSAYYFTVRAKRPGSDGIDIVSPESAQIYLTTGHGDTTASGSTWFYINASNSSSWSSAYNWSGSDIRQGYAKDTVKNQNSRGCVKYGYARSSFLGAIPAGVWEGYVSFTGAVVEVIHRPQNSGGGTTPQMNTYGCNINFGSNAAPAAATGVVAFQAPTLSNNHTEVTFSGWLTSWVANMCGPSPGMNGLLFMRNDNPPQGNNTNGWNGYVTLKEPVANTAYWRIRAYIAWSYTVPGVGAAWSTTTGV